MNYKTSLIIILIFLSGCDYQKQATIPISDALLEGQWYLDSTSMPIQNGYNEDLFFYNGKMYRCDFYRDGYFIDSATFRHGTIHSFSDKVYQLTLLDSNQLMISSRINYYYKKTRNDNLPASINSYRTGDLVRKDYIGFWKPVSPITSPVEILNTSGIYKSVSFEIFANGKALFYIDQHKNNAVSHSFRVKDSLPIFGNGCLVDDYGATWNKSRTQLGMIFSKLGYNDTIWFEKVKQ